MAIKTFTSGEVLTAADTNTYLANSGLVYISTTSITASGQNIANAFSSTYTNYRIVVNEAVTSSQNSIFGFRLGASTVRTDYKYGGQNLNLGSGVLDKDYSAAATFGFLGYTKGVDNDEVSFIFDLLGPQTATRKTWSTAWNNGQYSGQNAGVDNNNAVQTDINFVVSTGTLTGGTVTIYGYRKA
jgi:hypothetical protein